MSINFKNLYSLRNAKIFLLASLVGGLTSCKDVLEPEIKSDALHTPNGQYVNNNDDQPTYDSFMKHMPNVANAVFYEPTEDTHYFLFRTDPLTQNVTRISEIRDAKNKDRNIQNTYELIRRDNTCVNGSANFMTEGLWFYEVEYEGNGGPGGNWSIECVSQDQYDNLYRDMPDSTLANIAEARIVQTHPEDAVHAKKIHDAILNGQGHWEQDDPFLVTFNSKGDQQNLKYSDFGTFEASTMDFSESFTSMYSGGIKANEINKTTVPAQTFKATAFGNVRCDKRENTVFGDINLMLVSTGLDSATITIDALQNETIVMPFKNWYTVTIIRTNNSVVSRFETSNSVIPGNWQLPHQNTTETGYREGEQDNGLYAKDGYAGVLTEDGILTGTSMNYYTDETGYIEFVAQGYRQDWSQNNHMQFTFCLGGTNRPRPEDQITTGLDNVYCAPARRGSASNVHSSHNQVIKSKLLRKFFKVGRQK